jgi:hypothetical protein
VPGGYWQQFEKCPKSIGDLLDNAKRLVEMLWKMIKKNINRLGTFPTVSTVVFIGCVKFKNPQETGASQ